MSIVDYAKVARKVLLDWSIPQRVVFHHVPKCGGTSVGRALRKRYILSQGTVTPESSFRAFQAFTGRTDREQMLVDVLDLREQMMLYLMYEDVRCISLHVRFSNIAYQKFSARYRFITVLREPISRFMSHYYWSFRKPNAHARIEEEFEAFLNTERAHRMGAIYAEYFSGLPKDSAFRSQEAINLAVENLRRFDVVGSLNNLSAFEKDVQKVLGVKIKIGHENKRKAEKTHEMRGDNEFQKKVRELCAPDLAIWEGFFHV